MKTCELKYRDYAKPFELTVSHCEPERLMKRARFLGGGREGSESCTATVELATSVRKLWKHHVLMHISA
jgi:hypothetical protein